LVFVVLSWLVINRPGSLFAPSDFKIEDIYERMATSHKQRVETTRFLNEIDLSDSTNVQDPKIPKGWFVAGSELGSDSTDYEIGVDDQAAHDGKRSTYIRSKTPPRGFAVLMQMIMAENYKGTRLAMTGYAKSEQMRGWAGFWMRVDGLNESNLRFDNMADRPITGTTGWTKYQVVLDVPDDAAYIAFGMVMSGQGQVWFDDIQFQIVGNNIPTTDIRKGTDYLDHPVNLSFEELDTV